MLNSAKSTFESFQKLVMNYKLTLKTPNEAKSPLVVQFMKNRIRLKFYPGKTVTSRYWLEASQCVSKKEENFELINSYLDTWLSELKRIISKMETEKVRLDQEKIRIELDRAMNKDIQLVENKNEINDFVSFMDYYIATKKANKRGFQKLRQTRKLVIIAFGLTTKKTLNEYNKLTVKQRSKFHLQAHYKLDFDSIDLEFINRFRDYLFATKYQVKFRGEELEQHYKVNYINKQLKGLKQFITAAIEHKNKYVKHFTWKSIKSEEIDVDSVYTNFDEIQAIYDTHLTDKTEVLVRDKYVLNTFLGLRYGDLNNIAPHLFSSENVGNRTYTVYVGRTKKTDSKLKFALHPIAVQILEKYNYNVPKVTANEFNDVLKMVCKKAGLTRLERIREVRGYTKIVRDLPKHELMSSHAGRRSFCTNFYVEGVAVAAIMSVSGHTTEEEFRKYIKQPSVRVDIVAAQVLAIPGLKTSLRIA